MEYMWGALQGDLGESYKLNRSVGGLLLDVFPKTLASHGGRPHVCLDHRFDCGNRFRAAPLFDFGQYGDGFCTARSIRTDFLARLDFSVLVFGYKCSGCRFRGFKDFSYLIMRISCSGGVRLPSWRVWSAPAYWESCARTIFAPR